MKHTENKLENESGTSLYYQYWQPDTEAKAVILIVHGAGEHSGRYQHVAEYFVAHGYVVAALDLPGHGKSDGDRCYIEEFDDYQRAVRLLQAQLSADFSGLGIILLGHSMGGLIASLYLLDHQFEFTGCVLSGPAIMVDPAPGRFQLGVLKLLSGILPKAGALKLDASGVSRDPAVVQKYIDDPLVYNGKLTARMLYELFNGMKRVQEHAHNIRIPILLLHGEADVLASPKSSQFMQQAISSQECKLKIYTGLFHEIFNEPEQEQVFADVLEWIEQHK